MWVEKKIATRKYCPVGTKCFASRRRHVNGWVSGEIPQNELYSYHHMLSYREFVSRCSFLKHQSFFRGRAKRFVPTGQGG